ncbi:hypothetical protein BDV26DRAFT_1933 [Aspergillus bertholletiae]|uniref:Uncharacterized protein n=1 Tax=Aspergillus bertholletiae TaxID=1226010 RepID=A0A5N7BPT7_9EURO|nr:hypothetical protein BDV26DRAFT_1933 [Aspergillus bertholletiae]
MSLGILVVMQGALGLLFARALRYTLGLNPHWTLLQIPPISQPFLGRSGDRIRRGVLGFGQCFFQKWAMLITEYASVVDRDPDTYVIEGLQRIAIGSGPAVSLRSPPLHYRALLERLDMAVDVKIPRLIFRTERRSPTIIQMPRTDSQRYCP